MVPLCAKELNIVFFEGLHFIQTVPFIDLGGGSYLFNYFLVILSQSQSWSLRQQFFYVAGCDYAPVIVLLSRPVKKHSLDCKKFCV